MNSAACELLGYPRKLLLRKRTDDVTPQRYRRGVAARWKEFMRIGKVFGEYPLLRRDRSEVIVQYRAVANFVPGLHLCSFHDITSDRRTVDELTRQKELLQLIVDNIPIMLNFIDARGRITWVNNEWQSVLGWTPAEVERLNVLARQYPDAKDYKAVMDTMRHAPKDWRDFKTRRKDGTTIDTSWATVLLSDGTTIGIGQDITDRKLVEAQLRASHQQMRQLSARLGRVSEHERTELARELHDQLGQMLTAMKMDVAALNRNLPPERPEMKPVREKMLQVGSTLDTIIQSVRRISAGLRPIALDKLGLLEAIAWLAQDFERRSGIRCRLQTSIEQLVLDADSATQVFRIVQEALTNVSRHSCASRVTISAKKRHNAFRLEVHDNGKGIPDDRIHDPQSLGLLGMHERALRARGTFSISRARKGTLIRVTLPLNRTGNHEGHEENKTKTPKKFSS